MPLIQFTQSPDGSLPWMGIELICTMHFPVDDQRRVSAAATLMLSRSTRGLDDDAVMAVPVRQILAALTGPGLQGLSEQVADLAVKAQMAGDLLLRLLQQHEKGLPARVKAERKVQEVEWKSATKFDGNKVKASESTLKTAWADFRSVAHLWAAQRYFVGLVGAEAFKGLIMSKPHSFLVVGMDLLARAVEVPSQDDSGTRATLLTIDEAWTAPPELMCMSTTEAWKDLLA